MPEKIQWNGLQLSYPENWTVQEEDETLSIETPSGSFLSLSWPDDISEAFDRAKQVMEGEYEEVETEPLSRILGESLLEGITQRFVCWTSSLLATFLS
ncbi:MAG: hypothetical protein U0930_14245 [Pirellulales bacterium]